MTSAEKWEAVGHPVVKKLHEALCKQEAHILATNNNTNRSGNLQPHAQLLRAVELEDQLTRKLNAWVGEKKSRDFINEPQMVAEYTKVAQCLCDAIGSTDESSKPFWQKDVLAPVSAQAILDQFFQSTWMSLPKAVSASSLDNAKEEKKAKKHKKEKKSKKSKKSKKHDASSPDKDARFHPYAGNNPIGNVTRALLQQMD